MSSRSPSAAAAAEHERVDGQGYPDGLRGEQIPVLARILAVADCFDAMTSARAYREALSWNEARELLRAGAGTQFDPAFVGPFLDVIEREGRSARASQFPLSECSTSPLSSFG